MGAERERRLAPRREDVDRDDPPRAGDPRALDDELTDAAGADDEHARVPAGPDRG